MAAQRIIVFPSSREKKTKNIRGPHGPLELKSWGPSFLFQDQIWVFYLIYTRYWNELTFSRVDWALSLNSTSWGPSPNYEVNRSELPSTFQPLNYSRYNYEGSFTIVTHCTTPPAMHDNKLVLRTYAMVIYALHWRFQVMLQDKFAVRKVHNVTHNQWMMS